MKKIPFVCTHNAGSYADAILEGYDDAPVRSFVMTLAERRTRDCLRAERCDPLAV